MLLVRLFSYFDMSSTFCFGRFRIMKQRPSSSTVSLRFLIRFLSRSPNRRYCRSCCTLSNTEMPGRPSWHRCSRCVVSIDDLTAMRLRYNVFHLKRLFIQVMLLRQTARERVEAFYTRCSFDLSRNRLSCFQVVLFGFKYHWSSESHCSLL